MHRFIARSKVRINLFHQVSALLIAFIYPAFQCQCCNRVDVRITDNVFKMPLHRVNPAFQIQSVFDASFLKRVLNRCINIVVYMIIMNRTIKNFIAMFGK